MGNVPRIATRTPAGLHVRVSPAVRIDGKDLQEIVRKLVRGLYFVETGTRLPLETDIHPFNPQLVDPQQRAEAGFDRMPIRSSMEPGLRYRVFMEGGSSVWLFLFWGQFELAAIAGKDVEQQLAAARS